MGKYENIIGKVVGDWTVLHEVKKRKNYKRYALCRCSCGIEREVSIDSLICGNTVCCGKPSRHESEPLIGKTFGSWMVICETTDKITPSGRNQKQFLCKCTCGNKRSVLKESLVSGRSVSCGCSRRKHTFKKGDTVGKWTILSDEPFYVPGKNACYITCICECGSIHDISHHSLIRGSSNSCRSCARSREKSGQWKGGRIITTKGYVRIHNRKHPNTDSYGYVLEHHLVMTEFLGRPIDTKTENVHHKNGIKDDNRLENLELRYHPHGQKIDDIFEWAIKFLGKYRPEVLKEEFTTEGENDESNNDSKKTGQDASGTVRYTIGTETIQEALGINNIDPSKEGRSVDASVLG